ncbi:hypothetical protein TNCV_1024341 [Trichonephila clavipes]|nr:hypothetical protein TNCV_1024341 [Trichonephila clavipes]
MKEAIDIKMNPHRPKKPASDEYTSDEEEMIVYDVEDEIESNPDYVKENERQHTYFKLNQSVSMIGILKYFERLEIISRSNKHVFFETIQKFINLPDGDEIS